MSYKVEYPRTKKIKSLTLASLHKKKRKKKDEQRSPKSGLLVYGPFERWNKCKAAKGRARLTGCERYISTIRLSLGFYSTARLLPLLDAPGKLGNYRIYVAARDNGRVASDGGA